VPDPYGRTERFANGLVKYFHSGTYLVFRKLEQNVRAFKEYEIHLATALGFPGDVKRAGALIVGRFEDGTPIVRQHIAGQPASIPNNFTYDDDPTGQRCPLQAHIRKVNPRKKGIHISRIVRRGITYGKREKEPKDNPSLEELPSEGVGILFMCYQKNIKEHFEFLQRDWASNLDFPVKGTGIDPIIGQPGSTGTGEDKWPVRPGGELHRPFPVRCFVKLKGGEYFFAPSIYFFKNL
jgi:Dyp-type peroxidase family